MQAPKRQRRQQTHGIEMAGMIGHQDKGAVVRQMLRPADFEAMITAEQPANNQGDERAHSINEHVGLAGEIPQPFHHLQVQVGGRRVAPSFHRNG